jgi:cobalt-zinc-cadmium efflux system protein
MEQSQTSTIQTENRRAQRWLRLPLALSLTILALELVAGLVANSLALLSDAGHVLTDVLALALAWYAARQVTRPASGSMTFGYHRVGVLAAISNAVALVAVSGYIYFEAVQRFRQPPQVAGGIVIAVALAGLAGNLVVMWLLRGIRGQNLNLRSAYLHVIGDALGSVAVLGSGLVILLTGRTWVDPLASVLVATLVLVGAARILRDGLRVFLEASPAHLDLQQVAKDRKSTRLNSSHNSESRMPSSA